MQSARFDAPLAKAVDVVKPIFDALRCTRTHANYKQVLSIRPRRLQSVALAKALQVAARLPMSQV